jgi:chaperonin GroES
MNVKPLHDRVVVRTLEAETRTSGGIFIPDNAQEKPTTGEVLAAGPGRVATDGQVISMAVQVGDRVLFGKYAGTNVKVNGEELTILREEDIFAVVE